MDINKKLNELPVFMQEKSIDISTAIGSIGLMEAEAIVVLLEATVGGFYKRQYWSQDHGI